MNTAKQIARNTIYLIVCVLASHSKAQTFTHGWINTAGSSKSDEPIKSVTDKNHNLISLGLYQNNTSFNLAGTAVTKTSKGLSDCYIQKLDPSGKLKWVVTFGSKKEEAIYNIAVDNAGNIYATGLFQDTIDLNPGLGLTQFVPKSQSTFMLKLDSNGNYLWGQQLDGSIQTLTNILITKDQKLLITGTYIEEVDFDPHGGVTKLSVSTKYSLDARNAFLCKYNSSDGTLIWAKDFRTDKNTVELYDATIDKDGNIISCGYFNYAVDFDPGTAVKYQNVGSDGFQEGFVCKLTADGDYLWARSFTASSMQIYSTQTDDNGNIWLGGSFYANVDFDPGSGTAMESAAQMDQFLLKLDANGLFVFVKVLPVKLYSTTFIRQILCDKFGNAYIAGIFTDTVDFDPSSAKKYLVSGQFVYSGFIAKYNASGNLIQAYKIGNNADPLTNLNLQFGNQGSLYFTGNYIGTVNFAINSPAVNKTPQGESDAFMQKIDCNISHSISQSGGILTVNVSGAKLQWINCSTGAPIAGETGTTFTAKSNGSYAVVIEKGECTVLSDCKTITAAGIKSISGNYELQISPNPATDEFLVLPGNVNYQSIRIVDIHGKTVSIMEVQSNSAKISISNLLPGIYFVMANDTFQNQYTTRLVKL